MILPRPFRCTWCMKDTNETPCEHCHSDASVVDPKLPHTHHWSRKTINTLECKICQKIVTCEELYD